MTKNTISTATLHSIPTDLRKALNSNSTMMARWQDITPLAKNEWICWIESAKKLETRINRINRAGAELKEGKSRPCCWAGCKHRQIKS